MEGVVDSFAQCWGCPIFDRLFQIVSAAGAAMYGKLVTICVILFVVLIAFVVLNMVWQNLKKDVQDNFYSKSLKPLLINSLVALGLLSTGIFLPRLVTQITFEPTAEMALTYTQTMLHVNNDIVDSHVDFQPERMADTGMFRPQLRNSIIMLMKTVTNQFQSYIKLGLAVVDSAFSLKALLGPGALLRHIIMFFIGCYLVYGFCKLFINFCFYFVDIIVAMMFFAFMFPLGVIMTAFKADGVPQWVSGIGSKVGASQIKQLINAIVSLAAAVITYTVIMAIIGRFFATNDVDGTQLTTMITTGQIFEAELSDNNLGMVTVFGALILLYIIDFLYQKIPDVSKSIMEVFGIQNETSLSQDVANQATGWFGSVVNQIKGSAKRVISAKNGSSSTTGGGTGGGKTP